MINLFERATVSNGLPAICFVYSWEICLFPFSWEKSIEPDKVYVQALGAYK